MLTIVAFAVGFASNYWLPQRLGYTLLFGIALAGAWTWSSGQGVRVRMSRSRDRVQAGESIIERFEVINDSPIPKLWLEVEEDSDLPGHTAQFITSLGRSGHRNWRLQTMCRRRGVYNLGPITVRSSDPFDIFGRELRFGHRRGLVVYPQALELPRYSAPPANLPGEGRFRRPHPLRDAQCVRHSRLRTRRLGQPDSLEEQPAHRLAQGEDVRTRPRVPSMGHPRPVQPGPPGQRRRRHDRESRDGGRVGGSAVYQPESLRWPDDVRRPAST